MTPEDNWETSKVFFAYNDLGNLMGKIFHKFNLKYGFDGVKYVCRANDQVIGNITVTKDMRRAFEFLGLSWERFIDGFDELTDVFDYVVSSPYFDPGAFRLENLNAINKKRNKRRQVYGEFVKYVEDMPARFEFDANKDAYLQKIHDAFPEADLLGKLDELKTREVAVREGRKKFNGDIVMRKYPWLTGKALGCALHKFGQSVGDLDSYLMTATPESAWAEFEKFMVKDETFRQQDDI